MSNPYISEIRLVSFNFAPKGWALCNGQLLPISQNQALFALLGTIYGGNGTTNFALPNLQGRVPMHMGGALSLGQAAGEPTHTLIAAEMPLHTHTIMADATTTATGPSPTANVSVLGVSSGMAPAGGFVEQFYGSGAAVGTISPPTGLTGGGQPHENRAPFLTLNFIIALVGIFPSRT
jgi:microcystin-dependent protein